MGERGWIGLVYRNAKGKIFSSRLQHDDVNSFFSQFCERSSK